MCSRRVVTVSSVSKPLIIAILILITLSPPCAPFAFSQKSDPESVARYYLAQNAKQWGIDPSLSDLTLTQIAEGMSAFNVVFQQTYKGIRVRDAYVSILVTKDGDPILNTLRYLPVEIPILDLSRFSALSNASAIATARAHVGVRGNLRAAIRSETQVYFDGKHFQPVWRVLIPSRDPMGDWEVLVTKDNVPISIANLMRFDSGQGYAFNPNPVVTSGDTSLVSNGNSESTVLNNQRKLVTLQGLDSSGYLRGSYVDLTAISGGYKPAGQAYSVTHSYLYTRGDDRFEEVMIYYHVDLAQRYIQSLGFLNINNRVTPAHAHYMTDTNAGYGGGALYFGDSVPYGPESAEDADVIVHEYGHAVLDNQMPDLYTWEGASIHEGFADYLPCTLYEGTPGPYGAAAQGEWFARAWGGDWTRRVDEFRHYPEDMLGLDPHYDGQIWSGALWDIHQALGRTRANLVILESNFFLTPSAGFMDAARAILLADQVMDDGAYQWIINDILSSHGLSVPSGILPYGVSYPTYSWIDGVSGGVMIGPGDVDDGIYGPVSLGFNFPYYDTAGATYKTQIKITTNGYLTFDLSATSAYWSNTVIPQQTAPNDAIYPYWQDLYVTSSGGVYYKAETNCFIVTWKEVTRLGYADIAFTFEVILYSDGRVLMQYQSYDPTGGIGATIGLENQDGSRAKLWSYKYPALRSWSSFLFTPAVLLPRPWASIVSPSGWLRGTETLSAAAGDSDGYVVRVRFIWTPDKTSGPFYIIGDDTNDADGWSITWDCGGSGNNDASVWVAAVALDNTGLESDWSWSNQFGVDHTAPSTPSLSSPASGSSTLNPTPTFSWNAASDTLSGVASYTFQIDTSTTFNSGNLRTVTGIASTNYTPSSGLATGTWYWRVRAFDNAGNEGLFSSYWSVTIQTLVTRTITTTQTSTLYSSRTTTRTVTSYTGTSTTTSTVPATTTVVLLPLTLTSTSWSTQYVSGTATTTVSSYTSTHTSIVPVVVTTTVTPTPTATVTVTVTSSSTETAYPTTTITVTSHTSTYTSIVSVVVTTTVTPTPTVTVTETVTSSSTSSEHLTTTVTVTGHTSTYTSTVPVVATTTVTVAPTVTVTSTVPLWSTEYVTATHTTTTTSHTSTTTVTSTELVYTTVTETIGGSGSSANQFAMGPSALLLAFGFLVVLEASRRDRQSLKGGVTAHEKRRQI